MSDELEIDCIECEGIGTVEINDGDDEETCTICEGDGVFVGIRYSPAINDVVHVVGDDECEDFKGITLGFRGGFVLIRNDNDEVFAVDKECIYIKKEKVK